MYKKYIFCGLIVSVIMVCCLVGNKNLSVNDVEIIIYLRDRDWVCTLIFNVIGSIDPLTVFVWLYEYSKNRKNVKCALYMYN